MATVIRRRLLQTIRASHSLGDVWRAYETYLTLPIPDAHVSTRIEDRNFKLTHLDLHRLNSLLAKQKPRTRETFLRMLDVFRTLHSIGAEIDTWEWNALINCAGRGFRKTREEDYQAALRIFSDMKRSNTRKQKQSMDTTADHDQKEVSASGGDIVTYTTLLAIAVRSRSPTILRHASQLLQQSQLPPSRITELAVLPYFARTGELHAARSVIENVHAKGLEVGMDGLNSLMWVHASNGSFELPLGIYLTLRSRAVSIPTKHLQRFNPISHIGAYEIPTQLRADRATYTLLIQSLAYHGYFVLALEVFRDMLALPSPPLTPNNQSNRESDESPNAYLLPVYRAMFLGFSRHGEPQPLPSQRTLPTFAAKLAAREPTRGLSPWNVHNLQTIFQMFLDCAQDFVPSERTLYWILTAFAKTSRNSMAKMTATWERLDTHFRTKVGWKGRMLRISEKLGTKLPPMSENEDG